MKPKFPKKAWYDPRIEVRKSPVSGKGSFAKSKIKRGEKVIQWGGGKVVTLKEFEKGFAKGKFKPEASICFDKNHKWVEDVNAPETPDAYLNHSCNPNLWFTKNWSLSAKRNIKKGEELTFDYPTGDPYPLNAPCGCGSKNCRKKITGNEWKDPEFQRKYKGHFNPYIRGLIDKNKMKILYHGSPRRLKGDRLIPTRAEDLEKNQENMKKGVYATDKKEMAIAMAIISSKGVLGASLDDFGNGKYGKIYFGKPKQKYIYLHILPKENFEKCNSVKNQHFSKKAIKPLITERLLVKDYMELIKYADKKESEEWKEKNWS